ncbi:MAG: energy-coupling factor transporter transmembrane protein EcfT [Anaerolineaceae bacterium]|nr:energy-coupling factor transporter transmembrane protein EcfT [Anaerolineaceae bacterium]
MKTTLYIKGNSIIHRLDPRTKMLLIVYAMILAFIFFNPLAPLFVIIIMTVSLIFAVGQEFFKSSFVRLLPVLVLTVVVLHAFVNPVGKTPIQIGEMVIRVPYFDEMTWEGLYFGVVYAMRISSVYISSLCLILTTTPESMVSAIVKLGIPFKYASMFGMSLNMIPIMQEEASIIIQAQRARALRENNFFEKIQSLVPLFVPLAVGSMQQAEMTAMVLEARGFGAPVKRTELHIIQFGRPDFLLMFLGLIFTVGLVIIRLTQGDINWIDSVRNLLGLFWPI